MSRLRKERREARRQSAAADGSPGAASCQPPLPTASAGLLFRREMFRADLREFFGKVKSRVVTELKADTLCVCALASAWDPADDLLWEDEANRGAPRDLCCADCGGQLVMSNWMYGQFVAMPVKPPAICAGCMHKRMEADA